MFPQIYYFSSVKNSFNNYIFIGTEHGGSTLVDYMKNQNVGYIEIKKIFYNLIKAFHYLKEKNIVHNDITPINIVVKSPDEIKMIDFEISFKCIKKYEGSAFHKFTPSKYANELYLSPELRAQRRMPDMIICVLYDPFKSDVFSLGLSILSACGIDVTNLNCFGQGYEVFIKSMLTISYGYIAYDSLKRISYRLIREELQKAIDEAIKKFPYDILRNTLRRMLEVDIVERATIDEIYKDAKFYVGIFN
ncbi:hypothetical protein SteCoe_38629 [Stentor coeruleus]|uniref:Protein kinase domain-containing protein n=1 Tax=Stentor coeruleus TaxID=5963 RepID=A0A1R2ALB0_9CILI|nr:hypothetical protein SteCoe_38629 [Stentor coeruleus]